MRNPVRLATGLLATSLFASSLALTMPSTANAASPSAKDIQEGKALAFSRKEGNCLACHMIPGGQQAGDIGPPLIAMKARFPDRQKLFNIIWDSHKYFPGPANIMPPFGRNHILTKHQINLIIDFLYTH